MLRISLKFICASLLLSMSSSTIAGFPDPLPAAPATNPDLVTLGNALFFDTRLSSTGTIACASCHISADGGDDGLTTSPGVFGQLGGRNAQSILNTTFMNAQFWDGRAPTLEEQAKGPLVNPVEHGLPLHGLVGDATSIVSAITAYQPLFDTAFGGPTTITIDRIAEAIAEFERTQITPDSPFDKHIAAPLDGHMTQQQIDGMTTFGSVGCTQCHSDGLLAKQGNTPGTAFFRNFPNSPDANWPAFDTQYDLTSDPGLVISPGVLSVKVPSLRNIAETSPYFHNGSVTDLAEAVRVMASAQLGTTLSTTQVGDIVAFLGATTGELPTPAQVVVAGNTVGVPVMHPGFALFMILALAGLVRKHLIGITKTKR